VLAKCLTARGRGRRGITLDLGVETRGVECLEPGAKFREVIGRKVGDRSFDFFDDGHERNIARSPH
jgi:hypothetical protein